MNDILSIIYSKSQFILNLHSVSLCPHAAEVMHGAFSIVLLKAWQPLAPAIWDAWIFECYAPNVML